MAILVFCFRSANKRSQENVIRSKRLGHCRTNCPGVCVMDAPSSFAASRPVGLPFNCDKNVHMHVLMYIVSYNSV